MPFPEYERTVYDENPIIEVVCQFRVPPILKITAEIPAYFQDRIRGMYPELKTNVRSNLPLDVLQQLPQQIIDLLTPNTTENFYDFISNDESWIVSLNTRFLALTAKSYKNWNEFLAHLKEPFEAFVEVYKPAHFARVGLRYQNLIKRSDWGIEEIPWAKLLNPRLAGVVGDPDVGNEVREALTQTVIDLNDSQTGKVKIRHGLVRRVEGETTDEEVSFLIDYDLFIDEATEIEDGLNILEEFHSQSGRVFNWCISNDFRNAMARK